MNQVLYDYDLNATTWVYLASLLSIAVFFKFNRFWSVRNLDLFGLISYAPGLLLIARQEPELQQYGYVWLFVVGALFLIRILLDPTMVRRPLLEPNLAPGGMAFLGISLFVFLMVNVLTYTPTVRDMAAARQVHSVLSRDAAPPNDPSQATVAADLNAKSKPGFFLMMWLPSVSTSAIMDANASKTTDVDAPPAVSSETKQIAASRTTAILSHMAVVVGLVLIGVRHFDNVRTGISAATLYLLLPYTAQLTGHVDHVLPAALLVWAVLAYHDPLIAGILIGLASGVIYYPLFLLPLWCGFYWRKGMFRFVGGVAISWAVLIGVSAFLLRDSNIFLQSLKALFGWSNFFDAQTQVGFWAFHGATAPYRGAVMVAFFVLSAGFAIWPAQKNLGTLISCSAAVMLTTQFWDLDGGGVHLNWYLPLLLLTVFRPNLEDRVATSALNEGWFSKRRWQLRTRAA